MRLRLLKAIVFLLLAAGLLFLLWRGDGYLLIAYGTKTIEMTLWVAALAVVALYLVLWFARKLLLGSAEMVRRFREIFLFGSVERAQKKLLRTLDKVEYPLANYIAAARSSFEMGDEAEADNILDKALSISHSELPVALTRARLHVQAERYEEAINILKPIDIKMPRQAAVLDLMHHIYIAQKNWRALEDMFPAMRKAKVLSNVEFDALEQLLACEKMRALSEQVKSLLVAERLPALQSLWKSYSRSLQKNPAVIAVYAEALATHYQDQDAEVLVRKALNNDWYEPLINLYGRLQVKEIHGQIRTLEAWLKQKPQDATLLLSMGRVMLRNQQWELARDYFQRSMNLQASVETTMEMARLMEKMGDHKKSSDLYQQGLLLAEQKK